MPSRLPGSQALWAIPRIDLSNKKGRRKLLTELAVPFPELTFVLTAKGKMIDEYWFAAPELDVVRGGVRKCYAVLQRFRICIQLQQRGGFQQGEGPLVRVGDKRQARVLENVIGVRGDFATCVAVNPNLGNQQTLIEGQSGQSSERSRNLPPPAP